MNKKIILHIDSSDTNKTTVSITIDGVVFPYVHESVHRSSQQLLPLIEKALSDHTLKLTDVSEITLNTGPGSFTGLRVGMSVANSLAWSLGILVNGKKRETDMIYAASKFDSFD